MLLDFIILVSIQFCLYSSLTLREELRLRVFESRVLRRIFETHREKVSGGWGTLHNEEFHNLYASPDVIGVIESRKMRWAGCVASMGEMRNVYILLVRKAEGKISLERSKR
jgi:hypothetical protein